MSTSNGTEIIIASLWVVDDNKFIASTPPYEDQVNLILNDLAKEIHRSRAKYPSNRANFAALIEECGELSAAICGESYNNVRAEAIQVAAVALRIALDGDSLFDGFRDSKDLDALAQ